MKIDWNKAPIGAEFSGTTKGEQRQVFYRSIRPDGYEFIYPGMKGAEWSRNTGEPICLPLIPSGEQAVQIQLGDDVDAMVEDLKPLLDSTLNEGDVRLVCAAALDAGYSKFEIVEEDV